MADNVRCRCQRCRISGLMGPVVLITIGVLFLISEFGGHYGFAQLWPVILIVAGIVKVAESAASREGHLGS